MRSALLFLLYTFLCFPGFGQKEWSEKSFITFRGGIAQPIGNFGNQDVSYATSGLTQKGLILNAEYGNNFNKYLGLSLSYGMRRNAIDVDGFAVPGKSRFYAHTKWRTNTILANSIVSFPVAPVLAVYSKLSGGVSFNTYPELSYSTTGSRSNKVLVRADAFAYGTGLGLKFLPGKVGIAFETFALFTKPVFKTNTYTLKQEMNSLNHTLAFTFKIK